MQEHIHRVPEGAILFDATGLPQVDAHWFEPAWWRERGALRLEAGGRGGVAVLSTPVGECVLRHYRRGGLVARVLADRYLWTGEDRSRPFTEFRLLAAVRALGLPGPEPVAARYVRRGGFYRADLITRRIADPTTLAECVASGRFDAALAAEVGRLVARFHRAGIFHADLNAHNVLVAARGLHLIDFDRGERRKPARSWQQANMQRLLRSLRKVGVAEQDPACATLAAAWREALEA